MATPEPFFGELKGFNMDQDAEITDTDLDDNAVVEDESLVDDETTGEPEGTAAEGEGAESEGGETDELVISLGEEAEPSEEDRRPAPSWVRNLRKENQQKDRVIRELEAKLAANTPAPKAVVVGEKPTFEGCEYDEQKFDAALEAWHARKIAADEQQRTRTQAEEKQRGEWLGRIDAVKKAASAMPVKDAADAVSAFEDIFSVVQQGIIIGGPNDPKVSAQLRYALGVNPKKAKELAAIQDPVKFTIAIGELMTKLKVTRKAAPAPERVVRSSVSGAAAVDNQLNRLRAEAEKTGNYTKVHQYRQQMREKAKA